MWGIGVDQDEYFTTFNGGEAPGSEYLATSAIKRVDLAVFRAIVAVARRLVRRWSGSTRRRTTASPTRRSTTPNCPTRRRRSSRRRWRARRRFDRHRRRPGHGTPELVAATPRRTGPWTRPLDPPDGNRATTAVRLRPRGARASPSDSRGSSPTTRSTSTSARVRCTACSARTARARRRSMNVLFGLYRPDAGETFIRGERVELGSSPTRSRGGIGMVHQHFQLIPGVHGRRERRPGRRAATRGRARPRPRPGGASSSSVNATGCASIPMPRWRISRSGSSSGSS